MEEILNQYHRRLMDIVYEIRKLDIWKLESELNRQESYVMRAIDGCSRTNMPEWQDVNKSMFKTGKSEQNIEKCLEEFLKVSGEPGQGTRPVRVSELAIVARMQMPAISRALSSLEKKGMISRHTDSSDRRQTIVELTPQGRQFIVKAAEKMDEYMDDIFSAFTEEEQEELIRLLTKMKDQAAIQLENRRNRA